MLHVFSTSALHKACLGIYASWTGCRDIRRVEPVLPRRAPFSITKLQAWRATIGTDSAVAQHCPFFGDGVPHPTFSRARLLSFEPSHHAHPPRHPTSRTTLSSLLQIHADPAADFIRRSCRGHSHPTLSDDIPNARIHTRRGRTPL